MSCLCVCIHRMLENRAKDSNKKQKKRMEEMMKEQDEIWMIPTKHLALFDSSHPPIDMVMNGTTFRCKPNNQTEEYIADDVASMPDANESNPQQNQNHP